MNVQARAIDIPLVDIRNLSMSFASRRGLLSHVTRGGAPKVQAVDDVSLQIRRGEIFSLVGESGSGKTTFGRAVLRLVEPTSGQVLLRGENILDFSRSRLLQVRREVQMIFQNPYASLNPRMTVRQMLSEALSVHQICPRAEVNGRVAALLELVGLNASHADRLPRDFSGGQRQRIGIARALSVEPVFIVADEPVSAVDVSVQAQIMNLLLDLRERLDLTLLFIAHDLSVVRYVSTRVGVMYLGRIVEVGPRREIFTEPCHPYTQGLLRAAPRLDPNHRSTAIAIGGEPPSPMSPPAGCHFHPRCPMATEICRTTPPPLAPVRAEHLVACHHHDRAAERWTAPGQPIHA
ncbi:MAG: oligopeptide/dipeptide ABC transporter ATP-binding protein [Microvirga sp.]